MAKGIAGDNGNGERRSVGMGKPVPKQPPRPAHETTTGGAANNAAIDYGHEKAVALDVPLRMIEGVYASNRVDLHLSPRQALAYRAIYDAVIFRRERLANGSYVGNQQVDAIRWLLDKVADAAGF